MKTINETREYFEERLEELSEISGIEKIEFLVDLGEEFLLENPFSLELMNETNRVAGCVSGAYVVLEIVDGRVMFSGMAEAKTVNGFMAMLLEALNGLTVQDFLNHSEKLVVDFAVRSGIVHTLTPNRANAIGNIYAKMKVLVVSKPR